MPDKLDLSSYSDALQSLREVTGQPVNDIVRDATIQRFEYTFELAWKMIKRHLDWAGQNNTAALTRKDLFREAAQYGLISDPEKWFRYNRSRNDSSHAYSRSMAEDVYCVAKEFQADAEELLAALKRHHD